MPKRSPSVSSSQPDHKLLENLATVQRICLTLACMVAFVVLCGWLVPPVGRYLPAGWALMKVNTALVTLFSAISLACSMPRRARGALVVSHVLAWIIAAISVAVLLQYALHVNFGLDTLLAADRLSPQPGRMSPQTAVVFTMFGALLAMIRARKRFLSKVADVILFCLCSLILAILAGYLFGALRLFGPTLALRTSPQTVVAMMLLAFVAVARRSEYGAYSILLGVGTGGRIARIVTPFAIVLPFLLAAGSIVLVGQGAMDQRYATATVAAAASMFAFGMVVAMARLIERQEMEIRDLSLRDGLTELYNRRGFYVLAEQALQMARRSEASFSVLFIDLDNLKSINDSLGHDAGSAFLREVSDVLRSTLRATDIVGRIGGDEFVVAFQAGTVELDKLAGRLKAALELRNAQPGRDYVCSFSLGCATSAHSKESLEDLLAAADKSMYESKQAKKRQRVG